jgi:hypothetical protein
MLALLFALASLVWLVGQVHRAGWSIRRADHRGVYWAAVGIVLGLMVACKPVMPAALASIGVAALGGAFLYGLVADWQGWWRG